MKSVRDVLMSKASDDSGKYVSREFQHYGYGLADELGDLVHKALYIKMAKEINRRILEEARLYVKDYPRARNKARLFMWKVQELRRSNDK